MFKKIITLLAALLVYSTTVPAAEAPARGLEYVETANGARSPRIRNLIQWTHARLMFGKDLQRVAVGQNEIMDVEILSGREVLVLAKQVGRTSVIVWYPDQSTETFLFSVVEDHSLLRRALQDIHPDIRLELAPDRDALVLRGTVPQLKHRIAAESAAQNYLSAGQQNASPPTDVLVQDAGPGRGSFRMSDTDNGVQRGSAVINLIKVEQLPFTVKEKIEEAIQTIGGTDVTVRRIVRGDIESDQADTLILEGSVPNQVALVRVLNVAARLYLGPELDALGADSIQAIADESGGLLENRRNRQRSNSLPGLGFGSSSRNVENDVRTNIARSKLISIAGGRILSMIDVRDLPQVRVAVQIHEVDRQRMKTWRPDLSLVSDGYQPPSTSGDGLGITAPNAAVGNVDDTQLEGALQILGGALTSQLQLGSSEMAFDLLFSLMEKEGISRTLSRPTLTVLAGEDAIFQVGGEVPVPSSFAPSGVGIDTDADAGGLAPGIFSATTFKSFGVQLSVRPMVGEDDRITLDVQPTVSLPDVGLTALIAGSTGAPLNTTAFNTRSIETTMRLRDGQPMVIGGLVSRDFADSKSYTPGLHDLPAVGWLAKNTDRSDNDRELIIIVTPVIVREPKGNVSLWQFPTAYELMGDSIGMTTPNQRKPNPSSRKEGS